VTDREHSRKATAAALEEWREADRTLARATDARAAAQSAAETAARAETAAIDTAAAARAALEAATAAEASARATAVAAEATAQAAREHSVARDLAHGDAVDNEAAAHRRYQEAEGQARDRR
jgi:hypothetical protein